MACVVVAYVVVAYVVMANIVMACIVVAFIVMACPPKRLPSDASEGSAVHRKCALAVAPGYTSRMILEYEHARVAEHSHHGTKLAGGSVVDGNEVAPGWAYR